MNKSPHSAAAEKPRRRVILIDILKQQMSDLRALRKEVAEAELRITLAIRRPGLAGRRRGRRHTLHAGRRTA
jgi:hypothetical protein